MRSSMTMFLAFGLVISSRAQKVFVPVTSPGQSRDTAIIGQEERLRKKQFPGDAMPNATSPYSFQESYAGNNGMGSDIYLSSLDNMSILRADNNFTSNMPNALLLSSDAKVKYRITIPGNSFRGLSDFQKSQDSLWKPPTRPGILQHLKKVPSPQIRQ